MSQHATGPIIMWAEVSMATIHLPANPDKRRREIEQLMRPSRGITIDEQPTPGRQHTHSNQHKQAQP